MKFYSRGRKVLQKILKDYYLKMKIEDKSTLAERQQQEDSNTYENQQSQNQNKNRKFHLNLETLQQKAQRLEERIKGLQGPENKQKRKRSYMELAKVKKALENPDLYVVDPEKEKEVKMRDKERRIQKKIEKKQQLIKEIKRQKKHHQHKVCLACKKVGHIASDCRENPEAQIVNETPQIVCYVCGSPDHSLYDCPKKANGQYGSLKFAHCFICKEQGHISRECPKNEHGVFYKGGSCYICGDKTHMKVNCPRNPVNQINNKRRNQEMEQYFSEEEK